MPDKAVFVDRDGTMARDVPYCRRPEDFELFPNTVKAIKLLNQHDFKVIVITNQSGVARGYFTEEILAKIHQKMKSELAKEGASVHAIYYCPHHPADECDCRKPKPKLVFQAAKEHDIDLGRSVVIGDLPMDIDLGKTVGSKTILIGEPSAGDDMVNKPDAIAPDLLRAAQRVVKWEEIQ